MHTRPTSHSSTTSTTSTTTAATTTTSAGTTTGTPVSTTRTSALDTKATMESGLTSGLGEAMSRTRVSTSASLTDTLAPTTPPKAALTAPAETKAPPLPAPATWAEVQDMVYTDVTVTDSLLPAVLLRLGTATTPQGPAHMATVRIEGSSTVLEELQGGPAFDVQGGYSSYRIPLELLRLRPAPQTGLWGLLNLEQVASLRVGSAVTVACAAVVVLAHEIDEDTDELYIVVGSREFEFRLHDLSDYDDKEEAVKGGKVPLDGIWRYRIAIDEADVRVMRLDLETKETPAPGKSPLDH